MSRRRFFPSVILVLISATAAMSQDKYERLQQRARQEKWSFKIQRHPVLDYPLQQATGVRIPKDWAQGARFVNLSVPRQGHRGHFDWRERTTLPAVRHQGKCGSCWAFSIVATLESAIKIWQNRDVRLSEQQLIDCDPYSFGCNGGYSTGHTLHYSPGAASASEYPYETATGTCRQKTWYQEHINGWAYVSDRFYPPADQVKSAIYYYGPIVATVSVTDSFRAYAGGIYDACDGPAPINHMINVVGWDDVGGYWIIRNSWGADWGEQGYMRIKYGCNQIIERASFIGYSG